MLILWQHRAKNDEQKERNVIRTQYYSKIGITSNPEMYCVSAEYQPNIGATRRYLYDLDKLKTAIMQGLPEKIQVQLAFKFQGFSEELILAKFQSLQVYLQCPLS
jgi:hypothetical protein